MTSENETVEDIVKRVRRDCNSYPLTTAADKMLKLVREMDAAHQREVAELKRKMNDVVCENEALRDACGTCGAKREREATREKSSQVGNAAKMREALLMILGTADRLQTRFDMPKLASEEIVELKQIAESAISAPPRNCDIGTPDEHLVRHRKWCWDHDCKPTDSCKLCVARWAQMPYEEGRAK